MPCPGPLSPVMPTPNGLCIQTYCLGLIEGGGTVLVVPCPVLSTSPGPGIVPAAVTQGEQSPCSFGSKSPLPGPTCDSVGPGGGTSGAGFTPNKFNLPDPYDCQYP